MLLRTLIPTLLACTLGCALGCGSAEADLARARRQMGYGYLDRALAVLEGVEGEEARALRHEISLRVARREEIQTELEAWRAGRGERSGDQLTAELRAMRDVERDPHVRGVIELEISSTADWVAERNARRPSVKAKPAPRESPPPVAQEGSREGRPKPWQIDPLLEALLDEVEVACANRRWEEAHRLLEQMRSDAPRYASRLDPLLVAVEWNMEREAGERPEERFEEAAVTVRGAPAPPVTPEEPERASDAAEPGLSADILERLSATELAVDAVKAEGRGDFARAQELWNAAAARMAVETERSRYELRAQVAGLRQALRGELSIDSDRNWWDLTWEELRLLAEEVELSPEAQVGLAIEKLDRGRADGPRGGFADLQRLLGRGLLDQRTCWALIAGTRGEPVPAGGYRWSRGEWISELDLERSRIGTEIELLGQRLARGDAPERDAALAALIHHVRDGSALADELLREALTERRRRIIEAIERGRTLEQLEQVAHLRSELDARRAEALELIFDLERYFYPFDPPTDPERSISDYLEVQQEVDRRVAAVRKRWERPLRVKLPTSFRSALEDLEWLSAHSQRLPDARVAPEAWPEWIGGLDPEEAVSDVRTFAWTAEERSRLACDRALRAYNRSRWEADGSDLFVSEQRQVRITNDYRAMMGRRALAWNPHIQAAARVHSTYMADTGRFGHNQPENPEQRTPIDRMRRAGYALGRGENCHAGDTSPAGAHGSWVTSSAHHRNLLEKSYREMASALVGIYWTQDFGIGTDFEKELHEWCD